MKNKSQRLLALYKQTSKHSNYQILPFALRNIISQNDISVESRYEEERMDYLKKALDFKKKKILDIGGNTGYFSFEAIEQGAQEVKLIEGNFAHAEFVKEAAKYTNKNILAENKYFSFDKDYKETFDITLLLNVLHHFGDDYGNRVSTIEEAKKKMIANVNDLASKTKLLVLQIGFCWKGNRELLLFENGTKKEMIDFIAEGTNLNWESLDIAVPEVIEDKVVYKRINQNNIKRNDRIGEFLNRPIFILKSKYD